MFPGVGSRPPDGPEASDLHSSSVLRVCPSIDMPNYSITATERDLLSTRGWIESCYPARQNLLDLALAFGEPHPSYRGGPLIDRLTPIEREHARPGTMSSLFGVGAFPFHTDGAHLRVPPHFIFLRIAAGFFSRRPTLLCDAAGLPLSLEDKCDLARAVWLVRGGRLPFLSSVFNDSLIPGRIVVRFDRCCMTPANSRSRKSARTMDCALEKSTSLAVRWSTRDQVLILDNWRTLHGRGAAPSDSDEQRVLERVAIMDRGA